MLPLLIVLLFTIILGGGVYLDQLNLQSAARNGARVGSVTPTSACSAATADLAGNDLLFGGRGNDYLDGGEGLDLMVGGLGKDAVVSTESTDLVFDPLPVGLPLARS